MAYVPKKTRKVMRITQVDPHNNRTLKEDNFDVRQDITIEDAIKIFQTRTLTMKKIGKLKLDLIQYDLDIVDEKDIPRINARNYKDLEIIEKEKEKMKNK